LIASTPLPALSVTSIADERAFLLRLEQELRGQLTELSRHAFHLAGETGVSGVGGRLLEGWRRTGTRVQARKCFRAAATNDRFASPLSPVRFASPLRLSCLAAAACLWTREFLDAAVVPIRHEYVAASVDGDADGEGELPVAAAGGATLREEGPGTIKFLGFQVSGSVSAATRIRYSSGPPRREAHESIGELVKSRRPAYGHANF
jgi:hypothetical protein